MSRAAIPSPGPTGPTGPSRRGLLAAGRAFALTPLLAACGGDSDESGSSGDQADASTDGGPWSFKDDRGRTVRADERPRTIVAFASTAAALYDYGIGCKGVFGPSEPVDGKPNPQAT